MLIRKAVIPVAGLGTRMLPATKAVPKELVPVLRKPAVQWVVEAAAASGITDVIFVTSAGKSAIEDHFDGAPELEGMLAAKGRDSLLAAVRGASAIARIASVRQPAPLGLGHAILMAQHLVGDEPFAVILPDEIVHGPVPPLAQCLAAQRDDASGVLGLMRVPAHEVSRYGIVRARALSETSWLVDDMTEKPAPADAPSDLAISGPYVLPPEIFQDLAELRPGAGGEIQLTDALRALAARRPLVGTLIEGERLDTGEALGFVKANVVKALADPEIGPALREWLLRRLES